MSSFPKGFLVLAMVLVSAVASPDAGEGQKEREAVGLVPTRLGQDAAEGIPDKPENFQVIPQGPGMVMVLWDKPSSGADVDHYLVYVENEDMEDTTDIYYYVWNGLKACKIYTFGVRAVTTAGDMSDPALGEGVTDIGPPPEPQNLKVEDYTHTTVTLAWEKPDTQCDIVNYRVKYREEGSVQVTETTLVVSDLLPDTTYTFSVYAATSAGEGPAATVMQTTAPDRGPPRDLVAEGISSSAIKVSWSPPNEEPSFYLVSGPPCFYSEELVFDLMYVIEELNPCVSCFVTVTSVYSDDDSRFSTSAQGETLGCASSAPTQLRQTGTGIQSVFVEWSLPEFLRGRLVGWYLYWTTAIGHFVGEHVIENPGERTFEIGSLEPSEVYYVYVMAVNGAGRGEAAVVEVTTEYVPSF